jgi:hypothetical protein
MAQDNTTADADAYYGDDEAEDEELDLSFLDDQDQEGDDEEQEKKSDE